MTLDLSATVDIAKYMGEHKESSQSLVAFAAETENLMENALEKMNQKNADAIVANEVFQSEKGFGSGKSTVHFMARNESKAYQTLENFSKSDIAQALWQWLI